MWATVDWKRRCTGSAARVCSLVIPESTSTCEAAVHGTHRWLPDEASRWLGVGRSLKPPWPPATRPPAALWPLLSFSAASCTRRRHAKPKVWHQDKWLQSLLLAPKCNLTSHAGCLLLFTPNHFFFRHIYILAMTFDLTPFLQVTEAVNLKWYSSKIGRYKIYIFRPCLGEGVSRQIFPEALYKVRRIGHFKHTAWRILRVPGRGSRLSQPGPAQ